MRILFTLENYLPHLGGVETLFKSLTEGLVKKGHDVTILTHKLKGTKDFEMLNGVKILRVPCFHSRYWFTFLAIPKAIKLARKADIIHTTTYNGSFPARVAAKICKRPSIITVHEILGKNWRLFATPALEAESSSFWSSFFFRRGKKRLFEIGYLSAKLHQLLERAITKLNFDLFIAVSESTKKTLMESGVKNDKIRVIYNGVDYGHFNPKKYDRKSIRNKLNIKNEFIYTFYGRPGISKGLEYLLKAVPEISKKIANSKLMLILSKTPKKRYGYIKDLIKKLNLHDSIIFLEPVPRKRLPEYLIASDCIVVPSLTEGFGYTVAEASALGIPVVASNTTSIPEVISGKYILAEPKNPQAIADGVIKIFNKKYKSTKLKKFTIEDNIRNYLNLYKTFVSSRNKSFD